MTPRPRKEHAPLDFDFVDVITTVADEMKPAIATAVARPFLKWVGGKRSILPELNTRLPQEYGTYREPFLGGAALFFNVRPEKASLSDLNFHLVLTYLAVRDDVERLISQLNGHAHKHEKDYYLKARPKIARESDPTKIGALLIYLNKTCYNGLYRVNQSGEFNVPMGSYTDPAILDEENLRACSKALQGVQIKQHPFSQTPIKKGDFYYLDPPYHKTFSSFDSSGFDDTDHEKLAKFCGELNEAGCYFMVSNSDTPFIRKLYKDFTIEEVRAGRFVSCKANQRGKETELIIRNYASASAEQREEGKADGQQS
ncbi:MAG: DNA adenine methylase [Candidatus Acidiferrales bacterium]